jgi:DNA mismatch repair protein MutS
VTSRSILFAAGRPELVGEPPPSFADLNLDQLVASVTSGRDGYELAPFFSTPLRSVDEVRYRHEVLQDLESEPLRACVEAFAERMRSMRKQLSVAKELRYRYQRERWFLDAARTYCDAVAAFAEELPEPGSRGLQVIRDELKRLVASDAFAKLDGDERDVRERLGQVSYSLEITGGRVRVSRYAGEDDYGAEVAQTFAKFKQGEVKDFRVELSRLAEMNHVEAGVLDRVALLYPETFGALEAFARDHSGFLDETVGAFDREVQFYLAYLELVGRLRDAGLAFCYPEVDETPTIVAASDTFDIALADKLAGEVVPNDFRLEDGQRIFVVSGPNQGGKTTFARTFGQLHQLAALGLLVPGREATLRLCDEVFTHFEKEEKLEDLSGKLQDDLLRVHEILERATARSVVILNEIFTSTTLADATFLGTKVLEEVLERGALCVCVTFVEELAELDDAVVSMVSCVEPDDPSVRTFKVIRRPADGRAYALAIAEKYRVTYEALKERIAS